MNEKLQRYPLMIVPKFELPGPGPADVGGAEPPPDSDGPEAPDGAPSLRPDSPADEDLPVA